MSQLCLLQVLMGDTCIASQDAFEQHVKNTFLSIFQMFEIFCYLSEEPCMQILFLDVPLTFVHDLCAFVFQYFNMAKSLHAFSKHHTEIAHIQSKIYHSPTQCQSYSKILFTQFFGGQWHLWKEIFLVSNRFCMPFTRMSRNVFFLRSIIPIKGVNGLFRHVSLQFHTQNHTVWCTFQGKNAGCFMFTARCWKLLDDSKTKQWDGWGAMDYCPCSVITLGYHIVIL